MKKDIRSYLREKKDLVDSWLEAYFSSPVRPPVLHDSMKYSLLAGGKRIRPILCIAAYEACGSPGDTILPQACAIEFIHTYSLIHDDLPAMDNDDLRRGMPTNHVVFGEAIAILAGDALLTDAFRLFSENPMVPAERLLSGIRELASMAGIKGMVAGQAQDIISENTTPDKDTLRFIHLHKTAALLNASVRIGAILAGAEKEQFSSFSSYGEHIGLAFQVVDDILDITGTTEELGKPSGSDVAKKKMTYPSLYGIEESRAIANKIIENAIASADSINGNTEYLVGIAKYLLQRTH